ncbi:MAG: nuclease-related domain-containing protein [Solirubrobacteraceae bacterium]
MREDRDNHAGASAEREYERRQAARRERARERYGPLGALAANWIGDPNVEAWARGAAGEQQTARALAKHLRGSHVIVIHDRRIPGHGRANIDHLAIGPAGITVIDTKSTRGNLEISTPLLSRHDLLRVNGHDRTRQLDALERQIDAVRRALEHVDVCAIPITGALCYPFMRRRWLHRSRARGGLITVDQPRQIARHTRRRGPLTPREIDQLAAILERALPPAGA